MLTKLDVQSASTEVDDVFQDFYPSAGSAASAIDLDNGSGSSVAYFTNGQQQVGHATIGSTFANAYLWSGTAASGVKLAASLPATGSWTSSTAYDIDAAGNVFGTADGTYNGVTGSFAVEWTAAVPEPSCMSLILISSLGLLSRRRAMDG